MIPSGPGGLRELREAGKIHVHLPWYLSTSWCRVMAKKTWRDYCFPFTVPGPANPLRKETHPGGLIADSELSEIGFKRSGRLVGFVSSSSDRILVDWY